jgi:hypothetical protein
VTLLTTPLPHPFSTGITSYALLCRYCRPGLYLPTVLVDLIEVLRLWEVTKRWTVDVAEWEDVEMTRVLEVGDEVYALVMG